MSAPILSAPLSLPSLPSSSFSSPLSLISFPSSTLSSPVSLPSPTLSSSLSSNSSCVSVEDFLWQNGDATSLPSTAILFGILYSLVITLGVLGNALVIVAVLSNKCLQSVRNVFIVSLSMSDMVVCCVSGTVTPISAFAKVWLFGPALCRVVPLIQGTSLCFSTWTLTAIAIDRFILIVFPTKRAIQKEVAIRMIMANVMLGVAVSTPMVLAYDLRSVQNFCGQICSEFWSNEHLRSRYGTAVLLLQFGIPLCVIVSSYLMISFKIGRGVLLRRQESSVISEQTKKALQRRVRTNRMLIAMVIVFVCCWLPSVVFNFLRDYGWLPSLVERQEYLFGLITHIISMTSTVWNPALYALLNEQFRVAFSTLFSSVHRRSRTASGSTDGGRQRERCSRLLSTVFMDSAVRGPLLSNGNVSSL